MYRLVNVNKNHIYEEKSTTTTVIIIIIINGIKSALYLFHPIKIDRKNLLEHEWNDSQYFTFSFSFVRCSHHSRLHVAVCTIRRSYFNFLYNRTYRLLSACTLKLYAERTCQTIPFDFPLVKIVLQFCLIIIATMTNGIMINERQCQYLYNVNT